MDSNERDGWSWVAFVLGPFWYVSKGMTKKGIWLQILCVFSFFTAAPFVWIYCGIRGKSDLYSYRLREKSRLDLSKI